MAGLGTVELIVHDAADIVNIIGRAESTRIEVIKDRQGTTLRDP